MFEVWEQSLFLPAETDHSMTKTSKSQTWIIDLTGLFPLLSAWNIGLPQRLYILPPPIPRDYPGKVYIPYSLLTLTLTL